MKTPENLKHVYMDEAEKEYVPPGCEVYYLEQENMICNPSSGVTGGGTDPEEGGESGFLQSTDIW